MFENSFVRLRSWKEGRHEFFKKYGSYKRYIYSNDWAEKCKNFIEQSDKKCEWCGSKHNPVVHHKHYMSLGSENRKDVNIVCAKCHKEHHHGEETYDKIETYTEEDNLYERIYSELKRWRLIKHRELNKPAFIIFDNKTLIELSNKKPRNEAELIKVKGIKKVKAGLYGKDILRVIIDCIKENEFK